MRGFHSREIIDFIEVLINLIAELINFTKRLTYLIKGFCPRPQMPFIPGFIDLTKGLIGWIKELIDLTKGLVDLIEGFYSGPPSAEQIDLFRTGLTKADSFIENIEQIALPRAGPTRVGLSAENKEQAALSHISPTKDEYTPAIERRMNMKGLMKGGATKLQLITKKLISKVKQWEDNNMPDISEVLEAIKTKTPSKLLPEKINLEHSSITRNEKESPIIYSFS